ncbi:hypothetical protein TD95_001977 [Thielaviopsis punctulata]|uniref:serine--tRNA ligase n=1 Tax=Thielaviopsis punctulata TaxID=72032 RepID=A0A0F4ZAA8_9PEZI|nr:hypothetical protein TD95_001977 [Thielaviopsis punctulata]
MPGLRLALSTTARAVRRPSGLSKLSVVTGLSTTRHYASQPPNLAPASPIKPIIDIRAIRASPSDYSTNCILRNYPRLSSNPSRIITLHQERNSLSSRITHLRNKTKTIQAELMRACDFAPLPKGGDAAVAESPVVAQVKSRAQEVKAQLGELLRRDKAMADEIDALATAMPNMTSDLTPRGSDPQLLSYINEATAAPAHGLSHVEIGQALGILDFAGAANTSGWGFYTLHGAGAQLEQALVQYALAACAQHGWAQTAPPSMVYAYIGAACGFQPRDAAGEQQVYAVEQHEPGRPQMVLAGTAEIPLAGMMANKTLARAQLPMRKAAVSRCYRAEAGARGADTKGLYRVHEFTKVEMFAWTAADMDATTEAFDEIVDIQTEILGALGLRCRVLEMPAADLGASAFRKIDIEAFFPSRVPLAKTDGGWGEVSSASICTDYQARRLRTRCDAEDGKAGFAWTVNGTGLAVPRVLAAVLEMGWDGEGVVIPEVLRPWMGGMERIVKSQG